MTRVGKLGVAALIAISVALGAAWLHSRQSAALAEMELARARDLSARQQLELEAALAGVKNSPPVAPIIIRTNASVAQHSAEELLQSLAQLQPGSGRERNHTLRDIIYYLEALERIGESAVPDIRTFLLRFEDVAYDPDTAPAEESEEPKPAPPTPREPGNERERLRQQFEQVGRVLNGRSVRRPLPRLNYDFPPTLRLGLLDSLRDIGGESSERVIAEVMQQSGRALEVAYAAKMLKAMSGDRWRDPALAAAHELLLNPAESGSTARVDRRFEDYLYAVLDLFGDTAFAEAAGQRLVRADGTLDRGSFSYLARTLQQNALPTFQAVFGDPRVTNLVDRASLLQQAMPYLGTDPYANSMFTSVVTNQELPAQVRELVLQSLARGDDGENAKDLTHLQQRYDLLQTLKPQLETESYRRVNASLSRQLGLEVPAGEAPRSRRRDTANPANRPNP